ncbi:unnamed protein product [Heterobilharzia americana]|nr:unnamed protein product [Heterobilharzia americana]
MLNDKIKDELCQLRTKIKDADENITSVQMSNSNVDQTEENVLPHFIDERSSSPQTGLTIEYSGLKSPAIQSHYEPPFIRIQSPAVSVHQKSLADELYEADVDSRGVQTTSFKCGVDLFGKCVQCRSCLSFRKDNEIELQNNLLIQLRAFKNKMKCKRDWSDQFSSYLLHYGKTGMSCLHWSTEDINDVTSGSKKHFGLIIQQCWEILLLARIYFEKPPMPLNKVLMNIWKQFPKTVISGQALPNRSWSSPTIYASVNNSCRRRNTSDKTIQTGNGDDAIQRIDPRVTAKDHISCPNEKLYNEKPTNEKFQNGFTISFEELMNSLKADQENSVFDINIRTLANIRSEISLAHEVLTLKKEPYKNSQYKSDSATERHAYLIKLLKYLETQIYWSSERLTHISYLKTKKELINNSIRNINERTFTDTVSSIACFVNTSNSENGITSVSSHSNVNKDALKLNSQIYFKRYLITLRNSAKKLEVVWSSHCSFFLKNLVDNTKSVFSYPRIFYADDITWKMFMVLCLLGFFAALCFMS